MLTVMLEIIFEIVDYGACVVLPLGAYALCIFELIRQ